MALFSSYSMFWGSIGLEYELVLGQTLLSRPHYPEVFWFLSLRNLRINQFYFFQRVSIINNFVRYHLGFTPGRCRIFVWLFNFFTLFLPGFVVKSSITCKFFFKTFSSAIFYFCEKIFYRVKLLTYLYLFKN